MSAMVMDRRTGSRATDGGKTTEHREAPAPGKQTLSEALPVQRREAAPQADREPGAVPPTAAAHRAGPSPFGMALWAPVQRQSHASAGASGVHEAAARGISAPATAMPHAGAIQAAFGPGHDVSPITAHVGGAAAEACHDMGASAFASGNHVAFTSQPDLHTAAHEAAHVVQQAHGVNLYGGVGQAGDAYERHADQVADRVVAGQSAADLLPSGSSGGTSTAVQRQDIVHQTISETTDTGNRYQQELDINKTSRQVQIQFGINWVKQGTWASDDAFASFVHSIKTTVYSYLDRKFKIIATPKAGGAAIELAIDFLLYDVGDGYKIECFGDSHGRSAMAQAGGKMYQKGPAGEGTSLPAVTAAHEFGHCLLGVSDEYANPAVPARSISNDHSIMGNYKTQGAAQAEFKVRHFDTILKNVAAQYPDHTCRLAQA
jgi:hypothetical protein